MRSCFASSGGGRCGSRDRSVDVYVRKLRVKLEAALPGWSFIHTHFGFGYRLAGRSRDQVHNRRVHN